MLPPPSYQTEKQCLRCGGVLALAAFAKNCRKKDGLDTYCRSCVSAASAAHYVRNKEKRALQNRVWLANNPGASAAYAKAWRNRNPGAQSRSERKWYEKNREWVLEQDRLGRLNNLEVARAADRRRYWADPAARLEKSRAWRKANPALIAAHAATRRAARKQRTPSWLTEDDWIVIVATYEWCRVLSEATGIEHHVDHIVPLQGRTVSGLHVPWNLQCLPAKENLAKNNRHAE